MKLKLLLLFLCVVGLGALVKAQTKKPYNNLLITEVRTSGTPQNYVEFTNMGTETIDLSQFEFGSIGPWTQPFTADVNNHFMLPAKQLAPGKSFVIAVGSDFEPENWLRDPLHYSERITKPEFYKIADMILHRKENNSNANDSITPKWNTMDGWNGRDCWYLRHHFTNAEGLKDSMIIDQFGGIFDESDGTSADKNHDVAGVKSATSNSVLIRKNSIKQGITEFSSTTANVDAAKLQFQNAVGLDLEDSEWIPVPILGPREEWRAVFWTTGNQVNATIDANTLVSKTGKVKVDLNASTITVPWGVRRNDSLMYQFNRKPGLAWKYDWVASLEDSAYQSARTGDTLTIYACGDQATIKKFVIKVNAPTADDNIVVQKNGYDYRLKKYSNWVDSYQGMRITDGVPGMDTISHINFATRVDSLFKYLEKAPKATWKIEFKDGVARPDLKTGDLLSVTSESNKTKKYFIKLEKFVPSSDAYLSSITWPDMPAYFKGDIAASYGWAGDTIPGFVASKNEYVVTIPMDYDGIPALVYHKQHLDSKVVVQRAKTLNGSPEDRTVTFTVTAENDTTVNVYHVRFEKEKDPENVQPFIAEPFISQLIFQEWWGNPWVEIMNPGTAPLDLSHYMITAGYGGPDLFNWWNETTAWKDAYRKYVPGKKWQDEASWAVQPRILEPDLAVNPIVYPGDVFVMTQHGGGDALTQYGKEVDVNFATGKNPWGFTMPWGNAIHEWSGGTYYFYKILNDSVVNGLKPATDINDFQLIETFGNGANQDWVVGGVAVQQITSYFRKPHIWKGNPELKGSFGTNKEDCEWYWTNPDYYIKLNYGWPAQIVKVVDGIGSHIMNDVTIYRSTVSSKVYKVSPGYSENETIRGVKTNTTLTDFYSNIIKADANQTLKVFSAAGAERAAADLVANNDVLVVLSADSTNTSKYALEVTQQGLSANATLTSAQYTVEVAGTTGTVSGFSKNTALKTVVAGVSVPAGATMTVVDQNDAYMSLNKLNYDSTYVDVLATDKIYFEVIAENGTTKVLYQLKPTVNASDAFVTSDIYSVDQFASVIQFIPNGSSVRAILANVTPAAGASMKVFDKAGFERTTGDVYKDDKLVVTSADGKNSKVYYFSMLNFNVNMYLAYVISDDYIVDQVKHLITGAGVGTSIGEFIGKLYPSFGATVKIIGQNGNENTGNLVLGDVLLVTAADGVTTATYKIDKVSGAAVATTSLIKMYPNPTTGRVIVNGLAKGNRVQVFNAAGVTLRDVIVDNATDYVSLEAQPAGLYIFVVSNGTQHLNIQKIVKK